MTAWAVTGASSALIVIADIQSWSMRAYDLTVDADLAITPDSNGSGTANSNNFRSFNNPQVDSYWTKGGTGYNVRHYIRAADFTTTPLVQNHTYLFVYSLVTNQFDAGTPGWGLIRIARRGRCLPPPPG